MLDVSSHTTLTRTSLGEVSQLTDPNQHAWPSAYDAMGWPASSADPLGRASSYSYDVRNRLTHVTLPIGSLDVTFDAAGRTTGHSYSDGTALTYSYDDADRLTGGTARPSRTTPAGG